MKKSICLILSVLLAFSLCIAVGADPVATLTKDLSVFAGEQVAITLSFEGVGSVTSASVQVTCTEGISFVSAEFLKKGTLSKFDNEKGKGAIATSDINGDLLSIVVEGVTVSQKETVTVVVKAKNSEEEVLNITQTLNGNIAIFEIEHTAHIANDTKRREVCVLISIVSSVFLVKIATELIHNACAS